jgi:hypothetical protein
LRGVSLLIEFGCWKEEVMGEEIGEGIEVMDRRYGVGELVNDSLPGQEVCRLNRDLPGQ